MLNINIIRETLDVVKKDLIKRGMEDKISLVEEVKKLDGEWRNLKQEVDDIRHSRNKVSQEIAQLKKEGKDVKEAMKKASEIPKLLSNKEERMKEIENNISARMFQIPNVLHESVPIGTTDKDNVEVRKWGKIKEFDFELTPHGELIEKLGLADFKRAAKVAGSGFVYLKGEMALLDLALQRFAIDFLIKKGFTLIEPPFMLSRKAYEGVVSLEDFENVMYKVEDEDLYMIATSEHPMVAMYNNELLSEKELPIKLCGVSACFRKEIGSHGVDTRGLFRMHQFNKVEQVIICNPKNSWKIFEEIQKNSEEILKLLEIPYRVVNICTGDIGMIAAKKYDIEAWFPREKTYKEVTSCSNCTDYQANRLKIRYKTNESNLTVHTLNNTGLATSRAMRAILENYQQKDGTVKVPKALVPYMNGIKVIGKPKEAKKGKKVNL